jgi:hypothetical protein
MPRISNILNPWGKQSRTNLQRSDLWQVDLSAVTQGIRDAFKRSGLPAECPEIPPYFGASVNLPELKVTNSAVRRDSRSYLMPSWDAAVEPVRMTFRVDDGQFGTTDANALGSVIYRVLEYWWRLVRVGRGALGHEPELAMKDDYTFDYAFPVYLRLLRGYGEPSTEFSRMQIRPSQPVPQGSAAVPLGGGIVAVLPDPNDQSAFEASVQQAKTVVQSYSFTQSLEKGMYISGIYTLEGAWLQGFKLSDLNYDTSGHLTVEATICCDNILSVGNF